MSGQDIITLLLAVAALIYVLHRVRRVMIDHSNCGCGRLKRCTEVTPSSAEAGCGVNLIPLVLPDQKEKGVRKNFLTL